MTFDTFILLFNHKVAIQRAFTPLHFITVTNSKMEVASPFTVSTGSNKRSLICGDDDIAMETTTRSSKRQRFTGNSGKYSSLLSVRSYRCANELTNEDALGTDLSDMNLHQSKRIT